MAKLYKNKKILLLLSICFCNYCFSQIEEQKKDSTEIIHEKTEDFSKKSKLDKLLHLLIFKSKEKQRNKPTTAQNQNYLSFEGKIIRHIKVESHDPFGFSINDPNKKPNKWIERTGNNLHNKSKDFTIKNFIIFKRNESLDSLKIIESERLIRSQKFIREVEITVKHIEESSDSVDVYITTLDSWSILPSGSLTKSKMKVQLTEQNYLGFGHELRVGVSKRFSDDKSGTNLLYRIPNMKNTYINATINYNKDFNGFYSKKFNLKRPFFSPYTKWAAGIYLDEQFNNALLQNNVMETSNQNFKYQSQDVWAGYSIDLFKGNTERERNTNIISTVRFLNIDYKEQPLIEYDSIRFFSNENLYLASIGISSRQFIEDNYVFRDGITENVPIGDVFAVTIGNRYKNQENNFYIGGKIAHGNYYRWGYFSASFEYETFMKKSKLEQTAYALSLTYFTNLIYLGDEWKMRQFIKPQFLIGKNRLNSIADRVTIDDTNSFQDFYGNEEQRRNSIKIPGFDSGLFGTSKFALSFRTQFYMPWEVVGFRFNPYLNINMAMLKDEKQRLVNDNVFSSFSVGLIIRNDYLVFNSIQLSLSYYPSIPGQGNDIFNTNKFNIEGSRLPGFNLGKPLTIWYN